MKKNTLYIYISEQEIRNLVDLLSFVKLFKKVMLSFKELDHLVLFAECSHLLLSKINVFIFSYPQLNGLHLPPLQALGFIK